MNMIPTITVDGIISVTTSVILLLIFFILYLKNFETKSTLLFIIVLFWAGIISFGQMMIYPAPNYESGIFWQKVMHVGFAMLVPFWVMFVNYFWKRLNKFYIGTIFFIAILNLYFIFFTDLFITREHNFFKHSQLIGKEGVLYNFFVGFYFIIIVVEYSKFIYNYLKHRGEKHFHLPIIIGVGILILTGFKDLLETFFDTGIPMLFPIGVTIMNIMFAYALIMRFIHIYKELERKKRLEHEIKIALDIQRQILPKENKFKTDCLEIFGTNEPAYEIGGDFYDFYPINDKQIIFFIGDVAGKSVPAALYMAMIWSIIKAFAVQYSGKPSELLYHSNKFLYYNSKEGMFATLIYGIVDLSTNTIRYASAGHTFPIYYNKEKDTLKLLKFQNKPLGAFHDSTFKEVKIPFKKNDLFFLYTDGITETLNRSNIQFGDDRLLNIIKQNIKLKPEEISKKILKEIDKFSPFETRFDDITILALKHR